MIKAKEKVNYQEVYDLYQLCSETKELCEFCADYGVNYDKFMNWQHHQLWSEKLGKTVHVEQPKVAKVQITGKPCNSLTVKMEVNQPEGESPIKWAKLQLTSGATLFLRNTTVPDLSLLLNKMIGYMLGLSANLNYYLFNGYVDLRKDIFRLCESIREEMSLDPSDASNVYMFMSRNRKVVKIFHYERGFYVLYEKRPVMGEFKKPVFDEVSRCYRIQWFDMAYLTESIVVDRMYVIPKE